jgi:DNA modification methylase
VEIKSKEIKLVPIEQIIPNPKNPNKHPQEQIDRLAKIIDFQGFRVPLIVSNRSGFLVSGHGRLDCAKSLGVKELPVMYQDFESEAQEYAFVVSDNEIQKWAATDLSMVNLEMLDLGPDFDIDMLGIKDFVIESPEVFEAQSDEDEVPEVVHPITRRGDIWLLGNHRLMCGDSTMINDVEKLMNGEKADCVVTDPPYNVAYKGKTKESLTIQNDEMSGADFKQFLIDCFSNYYSIMNDGAAIYVFHADLEGINFRSAFLESGFKLSQCLVWVKNSLVMGRNDYHWQHEPILYGWKPTGSHKWFSDRKQTSVWNFSRPTKNLEHPTMKPVDLIEYPISNSTQGQNNVVADFFGGSGSTLIAAEKTGRKSRLLELDEKYCDVIIKRWENYTGKKATLELTGQTYEELKAERDLTQDQKQN